MQCWGSNKKKYRVDLLVTVNSLYNYEYVSFCGFFISLNVLCSIHKIQEKSTLKHLLNTQCSQKSGSAECN